MGKVIVDISVEHKLLDLVELLYNKEYFGFKTDAQAYVDEIIEFIFKIPDKRKYKTKDSRYGQFYCRFKANKRTIYFITFDTENDLFIVKNIISSHTADYPKFIKGH